MKVLGCKVDNEIYDQFANYGCISDTLRKIVLDFLDKQAETMVNHEKSSYECSTACEQKLQEIYSFLNSLEASK